MTDREAQEQFWAAETAAQRKAAKVEGLAHYLSFRGDGIGHRVAASLSAAIVAGGWAKPVGIPTNQRIVEAGAAFRIERGVVFAYLDKQGEAMFADLTLRGGGG